MRSQLCSVNRLQQVGSLLMPPPNGRLVAPPPAAQSASHRVALAGLELEVVCFVKHRILLHEELLIELLDYLRGGQTDRQTDRHVPQYLKRSGIHRIK